MDVKTKKLGAGLYQVIIDRRETPLVITKGPAPKYREPQMWLIGKQLDTHIEWFCGDQRGLSHALATVKTILSVLE
jgi:hypothetical protein